MSDDTAIREAAQRYIDRGWEVIVLHGVAPGEDGVMRCRCARADCRSEGKHPQGAGRAGDGWRAPIKSPDEIPPGANIGLQTGQGSGVFALDVDPKNGGDARLRELEEQYGPLPPTWIQQTGSGGYHYVFTMPEDFTPTNSRGRLPVGLDIRGQGGQIVLAPSTSAVGPYRETQPYGTRTEPLAPPQWLCDLIRPLPPIVIPAGLETAFMPSAPSDRGQAYAVAAVREELNLLSLAPAGDRNNTAFTVACRLIELSNAPWTNLSEADALAHFQGAGAMLVGPDFTDRELWACWHSAARKIGEKAAVLPAPPGGVPNFHEWGELGGPPGMPPFSGNGSGSATGAPGPGPVGAIPAQRDPFEDAGVAGPAVYPPMAAQGAQDPHSAVQAPGPEPHLRDYLLRRSQLSRLPRPVPLIQGVLWRDTDSWLIGASGSGKSFVGLDWAAHIASDREWNQRRVWGGPVIWVVAEGASGIQQRVDAWELVYGPIGDDLIVLPVAVQAVMRAGRAISVSPQWRQLCEIGAEIRPAMVLLDTQARMTRGLGENDNDEMGQWTEAVSSLRRASAGAAMLVVHHTGRNGGDARGASAIDGAQDLEWKVERTGARGDMRGRIVLDKAKDGVDGTSHPFVLKSHRLGWNPEAEEYVTSLTVSYDPFDQPGLAGEPEHRTLSAQVQHQILEVLREGSLAGGATKMEIRRKVNKLRADSGMSPAGERTIDYALDSSGTDRSPGLLQRDLVVQNGQRFADKERYDAQV